MGWVVAIGVAAVLGAWAGRATFVPPQAPLDSAAEQLYTVAEETVGRTMSFPVAARWEQFPIVTSAATGTVTAIAISSGAAVNAGDELYSVDLRPVVVAAGAVPAFRDLAEGSEGADVAQLQQLLVHEGFLRSVPTDSKFGLSTTHAVKAWQKANGVAIDGIVRAGDVVFMATVPARVVLSEDVKLGAVLSPGTVVASALSAAPAFVITLAPEQASLVPLTGPVSVAAGEHTWEGIVAGAVTSEEGSLLLTVTAPDGGALCQADCAVVPIVEQEAIYTASIVVVPEATGPSVPVAAILTRADGSAVVTDAEGKEIPITVISEGDGRAVVDGIEAGERIRLFAEDTGRASDAPEGGAAS